MTAFAPSVRGTLLVQATLLLALLPHGVEARQELAVQAPATAVDALFAEYTGAVPGCAVGVSQGREVVLGRAYGMAELEHQVPATPATRYEAGSVSKQFTAAATILLALEGRISLDDDVRTYVPELPDYGEPITIRHLLNHTSGLRDWGSVAAIEGWPRTTRVHDHGHVVDILSRQRALNYPPGAHYSYTNSGYNLQAVIVERVTGMSFAEFSRTRIFEPLGLAHTEWRDDYRRVVPGRSAAYAPIGGGGFRLDMPFEHVHGNGGLITTVQDLLTWTWSLETGALAGPDLLEEMHRQGVLDSGRAISYASGLRVTSYRGVPEVQHSGATAGYRAFLTRFPEQGLAVAVLCNRADANPTALGHRTADVFLEGAAGVAPVQERSAGGPPALPAAVRDRLEGRYRDTRMHTLVRMVARDDGLLVNGQVPLEPAGPGAFLAGGARVEILQGAAGADTRPALLRIDAEGDTVHLEPVESFAPGPDEWAAYTGRYHSDEAQVSYAVEVRNERLVLVDRYDDARVLVPLYPDAFTASGSVIRFIRDERGAVHEMRWSSGRVWDLAFPRER